MSPKKNKHPVFIPTKQKKKKKKKLKKKKKKCNSFSQFLCKQRNTRFAVVCRPQTDDLTRCVLKEGSSITKAEDLKWIAKHPLIYTQGGQWSVVGLWWHFVIKISEKLQ